MRKIAFIVNPKSGQSHKNNRVDLIRKSMPEGIPYDLLVWEKREQKEELFKKALEGDYTIIAAAGGDGTVNLVAAALIGTGKTLGIVPFGSGNGLARHLGIPLQPEKSIRLLATGESRNIDACYLNGRPFFCTAGAGFDAHIGKLFAESRVRGMISYASMTLKEVFLYKPGKYKLTVDGQTSEHKAFLVTFANAAQYGGDAFIAPLADIADGIIDITVIKAFPLLTGLPIVYRMFARSLHHSHRVTMLKGKHIILERTEPGPVHVDGEPDVMGTRLEVTIQPSALKVITE